MSREAEPTAEIITGDAVTFDSQTFLDHWQNWCNSLLHVVLKGQPVAVKSKGWVALSHIFCRLGGMTEMAGVKRDASAIVARLSPTLLQTLHSGDDSSAWEAALRALSAFLSAVPSAFRHHEAALAKATANIIMAPAPAMHAARRQAALCLALMPQVAGTPEVWSATLQGLLSTLHAVLNIAMLGLEDSETATACRATVVPHAQVLASVADSTKGSTRSLKPSLRQAGGLLDGLLHLLTRASVALTPLPLAPLLAVSSRILNVDVQNAAALGRQATSVSLQGDLAAALPGLHCVALTVVAVSLRCGGEAAIAHHAAAARLLTSQLLRLTAGGDSAHWAVRRDVYETAAEVIQIGGPAVAAFMAQAAIDAAQQELLGSTHSARAGTTAWQVDQAEGFSSGATRPAKKRRHGEAKKKAASGDVSDLRGPFTAAPSSDSVGERQDEVAQGAALELLAAVLQGGAARLPLSLRTQADALSLFFAHTTSETAAAAGRQGRMTATAAAALLLPALRTLLAAVLAPAAYRFPYLPRAMLLFRRHARSPDVQLGAWCCLALSSCEAVLHPQARTLYPPQGPLAAAASATAVAAIGAAAATAAAARDVTATTATAGTPDTETALLKASKATGDGIPCSESLLPGLNPPAVTAPNDSRDSSAKHSPVHRISLPLLNATQVITTQAVPIDGAKTKVQLQSPLNMGHDASLTAHVQHLSQPVAAAAPLAAAAAAASGSSPAGVSSLTGGQKPLVQPPKQTLPACSSDSEGSLPEIDSGGSESDDSDSA